MCPVALVLLYTAKDDVLIKRMREKSDSESEEMLKSKLEEYHMKSTPMVLFYQEKTKTVSFFFLESTAFGKKDNLPLYLNVRKTRKTIVVNLDHFIVSISNYSFCVCKCLFNVCNKDHKRRKNPVEHL